MLNCALIAKECNEKDVHELLSLLKKGEDSNNELSFGDMPELDLERVDKKANSDNAPSIFSKRTRSI